MKSMMSTKFGIGQGCIWLSTLVTKSWNFSLVNAWSKTSKCRILSSDNAGKIEYLEKCEHIYKIFGTQWPCAVDEKILLPCTVSMRSPSISMMKRYSVEMVFICKYKVLWLEVFPHKHLEDSTVIFMTLNGRVCNLTVLSWAYIYIIGIYSYLFSCKYSLMHHPWNHENGNLCTTNLQQLLLRFCKQNVWLPFNTPFEELKHNL